MLITLYHIAIYFEILKYTASSGAVPSSKIRGEVISVTFCSIVSTLLWGNNARQNGVIYRMLFFLIVCPIAPLNLPLSCYLRTGVFWHCDICIKVLWIGQWSAIAIIISCSRWMNYKHHKNDWRQLVPQLLAHASTLTISTKCFLQIHFYLIKTQLF